MAQQEKIRRGLKWWMLLPFRVTLLPIIIPIGIAIALYEVEIGER